MAEIRIARLDQADDARAFTELLDAYAKDPMGGGEALPEFTRRNIASTLAQQKGSISLLAIIEGEAVGLCNCLESFSTFACRPILNIHDLYVRPAYRQQGLSRALMLKAEQVARELKCCKLTLEVLQDNHPARQAYRSLGYRPYELDSVMGPAQFWQKPL